MSQAPPAIESDKPAHDLPLRKQSSFRGDVLRLVSGTGMAQLIAILAAPVLTRLYAPEAFGVAALFTSLTAIIGVVACMRYELSIVLPDNDREAANLLGVSLCCTLLMTLLTILIVWIGGPYLVRWVEMPELAPYLWMLPIAVLMQGFFTALNYWNTRTRHFTRLSISRVTNVFSSTSATLGAGLAGHATGGSMIAANVGGQTVATAVLGWQIWRDNGKFLSGSITWREMWAGVKRHRKFPIFSSWAGLLNTASWQLPVLLLTTFFGPAVAGFYALGFRILQMPMNLIGGAISQVFIRQAAEARIEGKLAPLVEGLFERLVMIGLFPMLLLTIIGRDLYVFIFGENWAEAGIYTQILSVWAFFWFISSPLSTLFSVLEKQEFGLGINILLLVTRVFSLGIGGYLENVYLALILFSASGIIVYGFQSLKIIKYSGSCIKKIEIVFWRASVVLIPIVMVLISVYFYKAEFLLVAAFFMFLAYSFFVWKRLTNKSKYFLFDS